jgi:hypothetical protein
MWHTVTLVALSPHERVPLWLNSLFETVVSVQQQQVMCSVCRSTD